MDICQKLKESNFRSSENEKDEVLGKGQRKKKRGKEVKSGVFMSSYGGKNTSFMEKFIAKKRKGDDGKAQGEYGLEPCRRINLSFAHTEDQDKERKRPKSVIHKSIPSKNEMHQSRDRSRYLNSSIVESLITETLKKTKIKKIKQKKLNKLAETLNKAKKDEVNCRDHQARLQNSKNLFRKYKQKARYSPTVETNLYTLKTDTSSKFKTNESHYLDTEMLCKRSSSAIDNNRQRTHQISMTPTIRNKKKKPLLKIHKKTAKTSKCTKTVGDLMQSPMHAKPMKSKSSKNSNLSIDLISNSSDYEVNEAIYRVKRNISVIDGKSSERSRNQEDVSGTQFDNYQFIYKQNSEFKEETVQKEFQNFESSYTKNLLLSYDRQSILQENFSVVSENCGFVPQKKQKSILEIHTQPDRIAIIKPKHPDFCIQTYNSEFLLISPLEKIKEIENTLSTHKIFSQNQPNPLSFTIENTSNINFLPEITHSPTPQSESLNESLSLNFAQIFIIEQLKKYEILSLSDPNIMIPAHISEYFEGQIEKKYSSLLSNLQEMMSSYSSEILENYSMVDHKSFMQRIQSKKQHLYEILVQSIEESLISAKTSPLITGSDKSGSSSEEEMKTGISHSRSLKFLHQDISIKGRNSVNTDGVEQINGNNSGKALFFGFQDEMSEDIPMEQTKTATIKEIEKKTTDICTIFKVSTNINEIREGMINISADINRYCEFIEQILNSLDTEKILKELEIPLSKDPHVELLKVGELQIGELTDTEICEFPNIIDTSSILISEIVSKFHESSDDSKSESMKIHAKMLLYVLDYLLQQFRPYGYKGTPLPWENFSMITRKVFTFEEIKCKILDDFRSLCQIELGNIDRKLRGIDNIDPLKYNYAKEKQIERVVMQEACKEEEKWINYSFEETQVKFDLADIVLYHLVEEVIKINV